MRRSDIVLEREHGGIMRETEMMMVTIREILHGGHLGIRIEYG